MPDHACGIVLNGCHIDIAIKVYSNRIFLIITHLKKFGSLIEVKRETAINDYNTDVYSITTLFGKDDIKILAAARFIAEQINTNTPLLLSLCLKDYEPGTLKVIAETINQIKPWK